MSRRLFNSISLRIASMVVVAAVVATSGLSMPAFAHARQLREIASLDSTAVAPTSAQLTERFHDRALRFEEKTAPNGTPTFRARGRGFVVDLSADGLEFALASHTTAASVERTDRRDVHAEEASQSVRFSRLAMAFPGSNPSPRIEGVGEGGPTTNYFLGDDRSQWRTGVRSFAQVRYVDVYPGVDVVVYGAHGQLEYDFVVAPGADPSAISVAFEGAKSVEVGPNGDMIVSTEAGAMRHQLPVVYQETGDSKSAVAGSYQIAGAGRARFALGSYDVSKPLVIDPVITYSSYFGGSDWEVGCAVAVAGTNVYLVGTTWSANLPGGPPVDGYQGGEDVFVACFDVKLSGAESLTAITYLGGADSDRARAAVVDTDGNLVVGGSTMSTDYPVLDAYMGDPGDSNSDVFVTTLTGNTMAIEYSTYFGGSGMDAAYSLAVSAVNNRVIVGGVCSAAIPTRNALQGFAGDYDMLVVQFDSRATGDASLVSATCLGGAGDDGCQAVAVDAFGEMMVAGLSSSTDFPMYDPSQSNGDSNYQGTLTCISSDGTSMVYSSYIGGLDFEMVNSLTVTDGRIYAAGLTYSTDFPVVKGFQSTNAGYSDGFLAVFDVSTMQLTYSSYFGGSDDDGFYAVAPDGTGGVYAAGFTSSTDQPLRGAGYTLAGDYDVYLVRVNPDVAGDGSLNYATCIGGSFTDQGVGLAADGLGSVYLTGSTTSTDFMLDDPIQGAYAGSADAFLAVISQIADTVGIVSGETYFLRYANAGGTADRAFTFGIASLRPLAGDWNGDETDTIGAFDSATSTFYLKNENAPGAADLEFNFGPENTGWLPVCGDWDGDGLDTVGLLDPASGFFYLTNSNTPGTADVVFGFGPAGAGWMPIAGDWDADGMDTVGLFDTVTSTFYLRNANESGVADLTFSFGPAGVVPVVGDWNGDRIDTIGVYMPGTSAWFLRNTNMAGAADHAFTFGGSGSTPITGDFDGR